MVITQNLPVMCIYFIISWCGLLPDGQTTVHVDYSGRLFFIHTQLSNLQNTRTIEVQGGSCLLKNSSQNARFYVSEKHITELLNRIIKWCFKVFFFVVTLNQNMRLWIWHLGIADQLAWKAQCNWLQNSDFVKFIYKLHVCRYLACIVTFVRVITNYVHCFWKNYSLHCLHLEC